MCVDGFDQIFSEARKAVISVTTSHHVHSNSLQNTNQHNKTEFDCLHSSNPALTSLANTVHLKFERIGAASSQSHSATVHITYPMQFNACFSYF
jgi:hypothetical protein